jgi:hypothetical protein
MYLTKKHLPRRTFLRGAGYAIALPLLDAMIPAATALAKTAAAPRPYMGFFYLPHGQIMESWTPKAEGRNFDLPEIFQPIADYQDKLTIVTGLANKSAISSAVHAITPGTWLSCVPPKRSTSPHGGVTIDQIAAQHIGQDTPLPTIEVATEEKGGSAACDGTYGCSFGQTISFRTPTTPMPMEYNPRKLFERLFGQGDTAQERAQITRDNHSILDMAMSDATALKSELGARDRQMVDNYLDTVRELERRVKTSEKQDMSKFNLPKLPAGLPTFDDHLRLNFDMIAIAYQAGLSRIATFMMAAEVSSHAYNDLGISEAFHPLSHHGNNPQKIARLVKIQHYHMGVFKDFLDRLAKTPDGDGTLLDHSILLYGGNMSNSNLHNHVDLPLAVFGGGNGKLKGGQHLRYKKDTPLANLLVTLLDRAGVPTEGIGNSDGILSEI